MFGPGLRGAPGESSASVPTSSERPDELAVAAATCAGIAWGSLFCSIIPFVGCLTSIISPVSALAAVGLGIASLVRAKRQPGGLVWAIAGLVGGGAWLLVAAAVLVFVVLQDGKLLGELRRLRGH